MSLHSVRFRLNGEPVDVTVPAERLLIELLRDELGATGTKLGCGVGVCGACTVLVDGRPMSACLLLAVHLDGTEVRTVEGLAGEDGAPNRLQEAFIRHGGFQCGICTSGQLMAATALLAERPDGRHGHQRNARRGQAAHQHGLPAAAGRAAPDAGRAGSLRRQDGRRADQFDRRAGAGQRRGRRLRGARHHAADHRGEDPQSGPLDRVL